MATIKIRLFILGLTWILISGNLGAQTTTIIESGKDSATVIAGKQYKRSALHNFLWGKYNREVWATPVRVPRLNFDTTKGGLRPTEKGGGKQTRHLRLKGEDGRNYSIRSIDKRYGKSLPEELVGTFIEDIVDDQMSSAYPYAGLVIKKLASAAGIYSTNPVLYYVGDDQKLDTFRKEFANQLYTLEDRPGSNNAKYYGATDVVETDEVMEILEKDRTAKVDQPAFVKARLFDLFIGDWDRHEGQWEWAKYEENGKVIYRPLPKDRDQAFSYYDGLFVRMITRAQIPWMQKFEGTIRDVPGMTYFYRPVDMPMTNQQTLDVWLQKANELKQQLTDAVIDQAVKELPAEIYNISGKELATILKGRRDGLTDFAQSFYKTLAAEVDVLATKNNDIIRTTYAGDDIRLDILTTDNALYYSRTFKSSETKEIRVYGIGGNDQYQVIGEKTNGTKIRFIGGDGKDLFETGAASRKVYIYDNTDNTFNTGNARLRLSADSIVHDYDDRRIPKRDKLGVVPKIGYTNEDRVYVGLGLVLTDYAFRKSPYGSFNEISAKYSFAQKAFSYMYKGTFVEVLGKWNVNLMAEYDEIRDQDFLGVGNNSIKVTDERHYYRYRNREANASIGLSRIMGHQTISFAGIYQMVKVLPDNNKFITDHLNPTISNVYDTKQFFGGKFEYDLTNVNDPFVPKNGFRFNTSAEYLSNIKERKDFTRLTGTLGVIFPVGPFTFASRIGAGHIFGQPEFYQLNRLGSGNTIRGFLRFRFYGNSALYNQNELQFNFNVKSYLYSGKIGLIGLFDNGRVWQKGETSNKWHYAVGGGLTLVPFNRFSLTGTYAVSKEDARISVRVGHFLK